MSVAPGTYSWQPPTAPSRRRENAVLALTVIVALIPALWFGLKPGSSLSSLPQRPPGTTYDVFPLRVSFGSAVVVDEKKPVAYQKEGVRFFIVEMTATVIADRYVPGSSVQFMMTTSAPGLLWLGDPANGEPVNPTIARAPTASPIFALSPGVETPLLLVWEQANTAPVPATLTIQITSMEWVESSLEDGRVWRRENPVAETTVAVGRP